MCAQSFLVTLAQALLFAILASPLAKAQPPKTSELKALRIAVAKNEAAIASLRAETERLEALLTVSQDRAATDERLINALARTSPKTDWVGRALTLLVLGISILALVTSKRSVWLSGSMETHSERRLMLDAVQREPRVELRWWDPYYTGPLKKRPPADRVHNQKIDISTIYIYLPKDERKKYPIGVHLSARLALVRDRIKGWMVKRKESAAFEYPVEPTL
jgi:hypothetical protein